MTNLRQVLEAVGDLRRDTVQQMDALRKSVDDVHTRVTALTVATERRMTAVETEMRVNGERRKPWMTAIISAIVSGLVAACAWIIHFVKGGGA